MASGTPQRSPPQRTASSTSSVSPVVMGGRSDSNPPVRTTADAPMPMPPPLPERKLLAPGAAPPGPGMDPMAAPAVPIAAMETELLVRIHEMCMSRIQKHIGNETLYGYIEGDGECKRIINDYSADIMSAYKEIVMKNESKRCIDLDTFVTIRFYDKLFIHKLLSIVVPKKNEELKRALEIFKKV